MIFNKKTKSENSIKTAIKNGILTNPENFTFDKIINKQTKRFISHINANRLIADNKASFSNFIIPPNFIVYNKIYINNKANKTIIQKLKNEEVVKQQQARKKTVISELKQKQKRIVYKVKAKDSVEGGGYFTIYNLVKRLGIQGEIKVIFKPNTPQEQTRFYNIDGRQLHRIFKYDSELQIDLEDILNNEEVIIEKISNNELTSTYANQKFLDAPDKNYHCLLSPIKAHFETLTTRTKTKNYIEIIDSYIEKYSSGIPESEIQNVCDNLNISIEIYDLFKRHTLNFYSKNSRNTFCFINQRFNHLELLNNYSLDVKNAKLVSKDELKSKYEDLILKGENPLYKCNYNDEITAIFSANQGVYYLDDPFKIARDNFNKSIGLNQLKFSTTEENIFYFLKYGSRTTTHQLFHPIYDYRGDTVKVIYDMKDYKEYDLKKAYSQFKTSKQYLGFPSKLTNYQLINQLATKEFLTKNIGYFFIDSIDYSKLSTNTLKFFKALGVSSGIYSSPELLLFLEHNLKFNLEYGLWSVVPFHFEFSPEMLETGYYKKWTGELNMFNTSIKYYQKRLPNQEKFLGHLLNSYPEEISVFSDTIIYSKPIKTLKTFGHIGGFMTAYTRTIMINELLNHNYKDILALKLDSFICKKDITPNNPLFVEKPVRVLNKNGFPFMNLTPIYFNGNLYIPTPPTSKYDERFSNRVLCLNGQGGSGKTHYVLTNEGIIDKIFSAVPWRLCVEKQKEFNVKAVSFACLSGKEFVANDKVKKSLCYSEDKEINPSLHTPSNIIIDEMTMLTNDDINKVISTYPYSRIWFIGDVSSKGKAFQTTFQNNYFNLSKMKLITFSNDYRSKCDKLKELKLNLRKFRELELTEDEQILEIYKFIKSNFTIKKLEDVKSLYNVNDWILCSTKEGDKSRAKIINNVIDGEKYRVISHSKKDVFNRLNGNTEYFLNGDWIIGTKPNIPESRFEKTNASTIHSVQGLTVEEENKIFIDLNKLFDVNLIYTAISRARNINQLYFFR